MQASMGQAATTLTSFLEMNGEYADGDTEGSLETSLLNAHQALVDAVQNGTDCAVPVTRLLELKVPVAMKYSQLNVKQILQDNNQSVAHLKTIPVALGMLEKYGRHLLKPHEQRVDQWRQIKFNNPIFKDRVLPMKGALDIVKQMGYSEKVESGLQFASLEPDAAATSNIVADIVLARAEMDRYLAGVHPHPDIIHALLPEAIIDQVSVYWEQHAGADVGTLGVSQVPSMALHQVLPAPTPVAATGENDTQSPVVAEAGAATPALASEETAETLNSTRQQFDDSMRKACDICGEEAATKWCRLCDNKQLCDDCDDMWHKHPKRTSHHREPIASLPSPSSAVGPGANIMGPFGIRAINSLSHIPRGGHESPTPVSSSASSDSSHTNSSCTSPPSHLSQLQSTLDAQASLHQHQQQLQYYQQLQQHQWQQQQQQLSSGISQYSPRQSLQEFGLATGHLPTSQESSYAQQIPRSQGMAQSPYSPFPGLEPSLAGPGQQVHSAASPQALPPPVSRQQHRYPHAPQPDVSLRTQMQSTDQTFVPRAGSNTTSVSGYSDVSLRQSQIPTKAEQSRHFGGAPVAESGSMFRRDSGRGPHHTSSVSGAAAPASLLLSSVLAEVDYEKRAAKCDIRLLTLEEELADVECSLKNLMLNHNDFCDQEEFRTLNRRKAVLMREQQTLAIYRQELAELMEAEAKPSDQPGQPHTASQIFHPPPLSSSPSPPFGLYTSPLSSVIHSNAYSPPSQQLGFGYPQQVFQYPVQSSEYAVSSVGHQKPLHPAGVYSGASQPMVNYTFPSVQESAGQGAGTGTIHNRSSVDRSSILPQWQMIPSEGTVSAVPGQNQIVFHPPPMYQYQENLHGNVPADSTGKNITNYPPSATMGAPQNIHAGFSQADQNRKAAPYRMPQSSGLPSSGPHLVQSHSTVDLTEKLNLDLHRPSSASSLPRSEESHILQSTGHHIAAETAGQQPNPENPPLGVGGRKPMQVLPPPPIPNSPQHQAPVAHKTKLGIPQQDWQCNHCTFINAPATRVCLMCDRTSDNPVLVSFGPAVIESQLHTAAPEEDKAGAALTATPSGISGASEDQNEEHLAKMNSRIAEEQDRIFAEKKEAQKKFLQSQQSEAASQPHPQIATLSSGVSELSVSSPPSRPTLSGKKSSEDTLPATLQQAKASEAKSPGGAKEHASKHAVASGDVGKLIQQEIRQQKSLGSSSTGSGGGDCGGGGGSGRGGSTSISSLDSETSFIRVGDFSQTMERFSEQKKIKEMQLNGAELMHFIKKADRQGYKLEEILVALAQSKGNHQGALEWLRTQWGKLVEVVISSAKAQGERGRQNDVGELSSEETTKALRESNGELTRAVNKCVTQRKELYARLNPDGTFAREEVLQAMLQSKGDERVAREQLHLAILQPYQNRVWEGMDGERQGGETIELLQLAMAESCQSVATSVISHDNFQQTVMNKDMDRNRRIRMVLVEGKLKSWGRAELVIKLLDDHLPTVYSHDDSHYSLEDVVEAVRNCRDRQSALAYLTQECSICFAPYPMGKIRNLNFCQCKICSDCLKQNFEVVIREKHVRHWTCPICGYPDLNDAETASEYLNFLGMLLHKQVDNEVYELFETKVRDWHLQKDPNFRWCAHCGNGFIADGGQLRMQCPHCGDKTCYKCKKPWEDQHEGLTCEQFAQWKIDNDPSNQAVGLAKHLEENGIDCPSCKMRYALAKGGCMHFKCPQCGHEFCSGCYQPFYQRGMCNRLKSCCTSGLHAHHPRDCFFYLRDDDVDHLQSLLREVCVEYNTVPPSSQEDPSHCPVIEQKEFDYGKQDESCGKETQEGHAGLCIVHYKEYLVGLINKNHIDPLIIMTIEDIKKLLKRGELNVPKHSHNEAEGNYRKRLMKLVAEKLPLPTRLL